MSTTQALLDLYTIEKELAYHCQTIDNMHICMIATQVWTHCTLVIEVADHV